MSKTQQTIAAVLLFTMIPGALAAPERPKLQGSSNELNIKELLSSRIYYKMGDSVYAPKSAQSQSESEMQVYRLTERALKGRWKHAAHEVAGAILEESHRYGFDPIFLVALIQNESKFNPNARGSHGEIGLMQLRPKTAQWISNKKGLGHLANAEKLADPVLNIRLGASYLAYLREQFDYDGRLYLAAYNMGAKNLMSARARSIWPKDYISRVMANYVRIHAREHSRAYGPARSIATLQTTHQLLQFE